MARLVVGTNSYVDLVTAEEFIPKFFDTTSWSSLTDEEKENTLINASQVIDIRFSPFVSYAISETQSMAFPRKAFSYMDPRLGLYIQVEDDVYPLILQKAVMMLATHFAEYKQTLFGSESNVEWSNLVLEGVGSVSRNPGQGPIGSKSISLIPNDVATLIRPLTLYGDAGTTRWWRSN
jgi:hypothetical protein